MKKFTAETPVRVGDIDNLTLPPVVKMYDFELAIISSVLNLSNEEFAQLKEKNIHELATEYLMGLRSSFLKATNPAKKVNDKIWTKKLQYPIGEADTEFVKIYRPTLNDLEKFSASPNAEILSVANLLAVSCKLNPPDALEISVADAVDILGILLPLELWPPLWQILVSQLTP